MTMNRLIRSELRKLTTTKMPWAFLAVLAVLAGINAFAVIAGTDIDGSKAFIATEADQQSLMAFAANALAIAGLFGAIAVAREYGHHTVVPTFLAVASQTSSGARPTRRHRRRRWGPRPRRRRTHRRRRRLLSADHRLRLPRLGRQRDPGTRRLGVRRSRRRRPRRRDRCCSCATSAEPSPATVLALFIAPPLVVQLAHGTASWMPSILANVVSGVGNEVSQPAAVAAIAAWALVPAAIGLDRRPTPRRRLTPTAHRRPDRPASVSPLDGEPDPPRAGCPTIGAGSTVGFSHARRRATNARSPHRQPAGDARCGRGSTRANLTPLGGRSLAGPASPTALSPWSCSPGRWSPLPSAHSATARTSRSTRSVTDPPARSSCWPSPRQPCCGDAGDPSP